MDEVLKRFDILLKELHEITEIVKYKSKQVSEPEINFSPANEKASDEFLKSREKEIFEMLDGNK